ncbi:hypothetical protein BDY19DRAFT_969040 [Irpex rosettiformis]|uniref:Uncharacterized protein n=1 Tax=Irpex rosettiformis TaxID=378272 RepID=A0ACB8TRU9_9APHY|nr:hypothetical protein BDY19DRAFT_969040 [Irpex rosettiformis]
MPHKRAKRSTREQKRSQDGHDNVPAKSALSKEAIPKGAARVLNAWKVQEEFRKKRKLGDNGDDDGASRRKRQKASPGGDGKKSGGKKKADMKIQPGESLAHFNRRVEDSLRPLVRDAMQLSAATERKARKEEEQEKAAKKAASSQKKTSKDDSDNDDEPTKPTRSSKPKTSRTADDNTDSTDERPAQTQKPKTARPTDFTSYSTSAPRRLNDIVQAPPELKKLPRGAKPRQAQTQTASGTGTKSLREGVLSMAQKAMLEEERERVIKAYREMKKRNAGE